MTDKTLQAYFMRQIDKTHKKYDDELDDDLKCSDSLECENEVYEDGLCEIHYEQSNCGHIVDTTKLNDGIRCHSCGLEFGDN